MKEEDLSTILIVEDNQELAELYAEWLGDKYNVRIALNGESAIDQVDEEIDVVILDRQLPGISGEKTLARLHETNHDFQVAIITAISPDPTDIDLPFDDYIVKPVRRDELETTIENLLQWVRIPEQYNPITIMNFELQDTSYPLVHLSKELACRITLLESIQSCGEKQESIGFYRINHPNPERIFAVNQGRTRIEEIEVLSNLEEEFTVEMSVSNTPGLTLASCGALLQNAEAVNGIANYTGILTPTTNREKVIESLREKHPSITINSIKNRTYVPSLTSGEGLNKTLDKHLTNRQLQALQLAYSAGYVDKPRTTSQKKLGAKMGVSQETFSQHFRRAQKNLLLVLFDMYDLQAESEPTASS